jgi:hypothetical protein
MTMWLLPQNPGPFGTLSQWKSWQEELRALGAKNPGVDVELEITEKVVLDLEAEMYAATFSSNGMAMA